MNILMLLGSALTGWVSAWVVNYLSDTLPTNRRFERPKCPSCQARISWSRYLIPRPCIGCGVAPRLRTWLVQILFPLVSILLWLYPRPILPFPLAILILLFFAVVAIIDLEHRLVLHPVSLAGLLLGLGTGIFLRGGDSFLSGLLSTLIGGAAGFGIMLVLYYLGILFVRRMARKKGLAPDEVALGFGDVNLAGILGLMLGWPAIGLCLFFAILGGGLISLMVILVMALARKYRAFTAIPYAPFLLLAAIYLLFS